MNKRKILRNAEKCSKKRQWDRAIAEYEKLTQDDFGETSLKNIVGDLFLNKGDITRSIECYREAANYYEERGFAAKAIAIYKKVLRLDANQPQFYDRLAFLYSNQGLIQEAIEQLELLARYYEKQDNIEKALETYYQISDHDPTNVSIRIKLAELYERKGVHDHASEEYARVAETYTKQGELGAAFNYYRKAYSLHEGNLNALKGIVTVYLNMDQVTKALDTLKLILEKAPNDIQALFILGRTYLQEGDQDSALPVFERIVSVEPDQDGVKQIIGRIYMQKNDSAKAKEYLEQVVDKYLKNEHYEEAIKLLQQLEQLIPKDISIRMKIAKLFVKLRMEERALDEYQQIADLYLEGDESRPAYKIFEKLYLTNPNNSQYRKQYFELARKLSVQPLFIERGAASARRTTEAESTEEGGAEVDVGSIEAPLDQEFLAQKPEEAEKRPLGYRTQLSRDQKSKIEEYHGEAEVFIKYGLHDNAISRFRDVLDIDPFDMEAHRQLRDLLRSQQRIPEFIEQTLRSGEIYSKLGDEAKAAECYHLILEADPKQPQALEALSVLNSRAAAEQPVAAEESEPVAEAAPVQVPDLDDDNPAGVLSMGTAAGYKARELSLGASTDVDVKEVIAEFRRGLNKRISPKDFETHYNLGIAYREMGLLDESISEFRLILNFPEMVVDACANLGWCYTQKAEFDKAVRILEYGVTQAANDPMKNIALRYDLAAAFEAAGQRKSALGILQEIDKEKPDFRDVRKKINLLKGKK